MGGKLMKMESPPTSFNFISATVFELDPLTHWKFNKLNGFNSKTITDIKLKLVFGDSIFHKLSIHVSHIEIGVKKIFEIFEVSQFLFKKFYIRGSTYIYIRNLLFMKNKNI